MRLWLSESERRPDPEPARADARKAAFAGTIGWVLVLVAAVVFRDALSEAGLGWLVWAAVTGIAVGVIALVVVQLLRRRIQRSASPS
jgi:uncharacterized membrane protein